MGMGMEGRRGVDGCRFSRNQVFRGLNDQILGVQAYQGAHSYIPRDGAYTPRD